MERTVRPKHDYEAQGEFQSGFEMLERSGAVVAFELDSAGNFARANAAFCRVLGRDASKLIGRPFLDCLFSSTDQAIYRRAERKSGLRDVELRVRGNGGAQLVLCGDFMQGDSQCDRRLLGVFVDATEVFNLRSAMQRSARLEALGSLTSGVAHDFNNLLTVLIGNLALTAESLRGRPDDFAKIKSARDAATRGADMIQQLLAFAREKSIESELVNPARVVQKLMPLVSRALGSRIKLEARVAEHVGAFRGNAAQLESVVVNLAVNARDAMPSGGTVTLKVGERPFDLAEASRRRLHAPGSYVLVEVADTGSGIAPETLEKVFEPFFSTKGDRGSGLGLAMVRSFAAQCGGTAFIESTVGVGTVVTLAFPRCDESLDETNAKTMPLSTLPSGRESVLVLAGEEGMRSTISQILAVLGYTVRTAANPEEATRLLGEQPSELVILDWADAGRVWSALSGAGNGEVVGCRVVELQSSGLDATSRVPGASTLLKPFSLADLAGTVRAALDAPRPV
jgi:signal transduction histidine kinase